MAKAIWKITGVEEVQTNLNKAIDSVNSNSVDGLAAAGQFVKGEAMKLTPIDKGILIKSAFSKPTDSSGKTIEIGYTAEYAAAVHEQLNIIKFKRPGAENRFLEKAIVRNMTKIVNIIARFARK